MKRNLLRLGAAGIALAVASLGSLSAAHLTGLTLFGVNFASNELVSIDPATGAGSIIGSFGDTTFATGLGVRNGRLFVFDQVDDRIREVNKISGELVSSIDIGVGNLNGEGALAFRPSDGVGFLASPLNANNEPTNDFFMFVITPNGASGTSVRLGSTTVNGQPLAIDAMAFNSQGVLYAIGQAADATLYTINTTTGAATAVGPVVLSGASPTPIVKNSPIAGMTVGPANPDMANVEEIYASINDILYIITPSSGAARRGPGAPAGQNVALNFGPFVSSVSGLAFSPGAGTLGNMAGRLAVGTGANVGISGFIIRGTPAKRVLLRGRGPTLPGLTGTLADPVLELFNAQGVSIARNDNFGDNSEADRTAIQNEGLAPSNSREAAIIRTLPDGAYTAILSGAGGSTGVGLVEVFDVDVGSGSRLANLSTRGLVQPGDLTVIGSLIVSGSAPQRVVARAIGPDLANRGVPNPLPDPRLDFHDANGTVIKSNDNFSQSPDAVEIMSRGLAPANSLEAAVILDVAPGAYTAVVRGSGSTTTGIAVVEIYNVTPAPSSPPPVN